MPVRSALLVLFVCAPHLAFATTTSTVDEVARVVRCESRAASDPTASNVAAARLGAERVARARAESCLCAAIDALPLDAGRTVGSEKPGCAADSVIGQVAHAARLEHEFPAVDGSVTLVLSVNFDEVVKAVEPGVSMAPKLAVDARGLALGRALVARVVAEDGTVLARGPAHYAAVAPKDVPLVKAEKKADPGVSDVIVPRSRLGQAAGKVPLDGAVLFVVDAGETRPAPGR